MILIIIKIVSIEIVLSIIFMIMGFYKNQKSKSIFNSILKGWLERGFICFGLLNDIAIILIFFSALKLGTRLHEETKQSKISNDQFLIGNIISVSAGIVYFILLKSFVL